MPIAIYALALAAFAIGTAEFVISGILPALSDDLAVSIPTVGLLVSGYAAGVAVGGPLLAVLTARLPAKPMLVGLTLFFALGQVLCAIAPDYGLLMAARLTSAAAHGVFFGLGSVAVAGLVPPERRGSALALFVGGITVANILGLPGGTWIGNTFGWRASFWSIAGFAALAAIAIALLLPAARSQGAGPPLRAQLRELRHQQVFTSYLVISLVMVGALAFATFQVPVLTDITRLDPGIVPLFLLIGGAGSVTGIYIGGRLADRWLMPALAGMIALQVVFNLTLLAAVHHPMLVAANLFIISGVTFGFGPPNQVRILNAARAAPQMASTLISTAYNVGIAGGALLGAMLLSNGLPYDWLPIVSVVSSALALGVVLLSWTAERRAGLPATAAG